MRLTCCKFVIVVVRHNCTFYVGCSLEKNLYEVLYVRLSFVVVFVRCASLRPAAFIRVLIPILT